MEKRNYKQACSLAVALDVIGERWTWLILRGLLTGPKRFGELLDQLPGIGTNLLADRLKWLGEKQVVEKAGSGRQAAYRLTRTGEALRSATHELIRWGRHFAGDIGEESVARPEWDMLAIEAHFDAGRAVGIDTVLELTLSDFVFHLVIRNRSCRAVTGHAVAPDARISSDSDTLLAIGSGRLSTREAVASDRLEMTGDPEAGRLLFEVFGPLA